MHAVSCKGAGCSAYSTLNLKNAALSSGANSRQMLPSTTDKESGVTVRGAKVLRSADSKRLNFICTLPCAGDGVRGAGKSVHTWCSHLPTPEKAKAPKSLNFRAFVGYGDRI